MASQVVPPFADQLVLNLDVAPDQTADAEVVGQALLAWVAASRAAAEVLDPLIQLKIGLIGVEPGSVRLRAVFRYIEDHIIGPPADFLGEFPRIKRFAEQLVIGTVIGIPVGLVVVIGEHHMYPEAAKHASAQVQEQFQEGQKKVGESPKVQKEVRRFYRAVERDKAVTGVSVRDGDTLKPLIEVPKTEFPERSGLWEMQEQDPPTREQSAIWDVVVTYPALFSKPKPWWFIRDGLPFSATMTDEQFLRAIAEGTLPLHIQEGVEMRVKVEWTERLEGQTWEPINRTRKITKVISPLPSTTPTPLLR
jgi:hypothetical protein